MFAMLPVKSLGFLPQAGRAAGRAAGMTGLASRVASKRFASGMSKDSNGRGKQHETTRIA